MFSGKEETGNLSIRTRNLVADINIDVINIQIHFRTTDGFSKPSQLDYQVLWSI